jgi:5'-methylthioadenosine phosphorylase
MKKMIEKISLAVIGGSGLYEMPGLENIQELEIETPFGSPSAPIVVGTMEGQRVAFLARHGRGHSLSPSEINYRANIFSLKMLGTERILSINACGSLREDYIPGDIVLPDQLFDFTRSRPRTFFGNGIVAHVGCADPFCPQLTATVGNAVLEAGGVVHTGGTLVIIEGPRFSTKAESNAFRAWGMSIIGMTSAPEAFLAREAECCYSVMAHVTDYDVWHLNETPVSVDVVVQTLNKNTQLAQAAIHKLLRQLPPLDACTCSSTLSGAIITDQKVIPTETRKKLDLLVKKYLHPVI